MEMLVGAAVDHEGATPRKNHHRWMNSAMERSSNTPLALSGLGVGSYDALRESLTRPLPLASSVGVGPSVGCASGVDRNAEFLSTHQY